VTDFTPITASEARTLRENGTRPIDEAPGYEIDAEGRVWSTSTNWRGYGRRELAAHEDQHGYLKVRLTLAKGRRIKRPVHRLVAFAFLGQPPTPTHQVRHLDGNRTNNRADNLCWGTPAENAADRDRHGTTARGSRSGTSKLSDEEVRQIRGDAEVMPRWAVAEKYGITREHVNKIVWREAWRHVA
jgi:hypothetical protein